MKTVKVKVKFLKLAEKITKEHNYDPDTYNGNIFCFMIEFLITEYKCNFNNVSIIELSEDNYVLFYLKYSEFIIESIVI